MKETGTVLVTGANKGIGLEFVRQYLAAGWRVIATARRPAGAQELNALAADGDLAVVPLDVRDLDAVDALAAELSGQAIDVLINNAGLFGDFARQSWPAIAFEDFDTFMQTNARGALKMSIAFTPHVAASPRGRIVAITSQAGSFGLDSGGLPGQYFYKASKAALNMFMRTLAKDLADRGIVVCILSPGMVATRPVPPERRFPGLLDPPESIAGMIRVIDGLTAADNGRFLRYNGEEQPW